MDSSKRPFKTYPRLTPLQAGLEKTWARIQQEDKGLQMQRQLGKMIIVRITDIAVFQSIQTATTKYHRTGAYKQQKCYFSQFWRVESTRSSYCKIQCQVRAHFPGHRWLSFPWEDGEARGKWYKVIKFTPVRVGNYLIMAKNNKLKIVDTFSLILEAC